MKKNKQELILEVADLAKLHQQKKDAIEKIFSDLDKEQKISNRHLGGIATVNDILKEMADIELKHEEMLKQIKES